MTGFGIGLLAGEALLEAAAALLVEGFRDNWPDAWPTIEDGRVEVAEALEAGRVALAAVGPGGELAGWIGAIPEYRGRVWEVHPLVVDAAWRRRGVARALGDALAERAAGAGASTLWVGTDDEAGLTSIGGVDLYPDPLQHLASLRDLRGHPFAIYRRLGFCVAGVVPDANGPGRPDILMARRVGGAR